MLVQLMQVQAATGGWVGPVAAVSLLVIALAFIAIAAAMVITLRAIAAQVRAMGATVSRLEERVLPTLDLFKAVATDGKEIAGMVRSEATRIVRTSRVLRHRVRRGAQRIEERLEDLDALYEVVHNEVEDAALDLAALVRTVRTGGGWLQRLRRFFPARRRRR